MARSKAENTPKIKFGRKLAYGVLNIISKNGIMGKDKNLGLAPNAL